MSSNAAASCASIEGTMKASSATTAGADKSSRATTEALCARATPAVSGVVEVEQVRCECCGLAEECTPAYIARVRSLHCGRWVCGLCAEAVKDERGKAGGGGRLDEGVEDALRAHMSFCMDFNKSERMSPVTHIAAAMRRLLRRSLDAGSGSRSAPSSPRRSIVSRSNSCITSLPRECTTTSLESLLSSSDARSASFRSAASYR